MFDDLDVCDPEEARRPAFAPLLRSVKDAGEDYEFYPTSQKMIEAIGRRLRKLERSHSFRHGEDCSILDIGAGDGRVLVGLAKYFEHAPTLYAIEKASVLIHAQPDNVIPVGTEFFEQNLACLQVRYLVSNPPYSDYETWASIIIESGFASRGFLIIPRRWKQSASIAQSLKKRRATAEIIYSGDFYDAPRQARSVIDIVEISYPVKDDGYRDELEDPFDQWFNLNISTFEAEEEGRYSKYETDYAREQQALAKIRHLSTIGEMVESYREEYSRMEENYKSIFRLDYALLKELGVNKESVREGIKAKMVGLKARYWTLLFERLDAITDRLSTATKARFTERLIGRTTVAFTAQNAYAVVLWSIKNANRYFDEQTVALYRDLSTFEGVLRYKSNVRVWQQNQWRYFMRNDEDGPSHYSLDYRIVVTRGGGIGTGYNYPGNLSDGCHEVIADTVAVLYNLGFPSRGPRSQDRCWYSGGWQNWYRVGKEPPEILFQVKAHKNGNLHFRFLPDAIRALNVEAGRLLGWLRGPEDVVAELGYSEEEAVRFFGCIQAITPASARLMLGAGEEGS